MARMILVAALVLSSACGDEPLFRTPHGIDVYGEGITANQVHVAMFNHTVDELVYQAHTLLGYEYHAFSSYWALDGTDVYLEADVIDCTGVVDSGRCAGLTHGYAQYVRVFWDSLCPAATSLAHELMHVIQIKLTGTRGHPEKLFGAGSPVVNTNMHILQDCAREGLLND